MPSVEYQAKLDYISPGSPGSSWETNWKRRFLVKALATKNVKTLWVHRSIIHQVNALCLYLNANGAKLGEKVDDWGFANRDVRAVPGVKSYHAWGLAVDLDATENPMGVRRTSFAKTQKDRDEIRQVCKWLGFRWGLDYESRPDPMHFESLVSRRRAKWIGAQLGLPTWRTRKLAKLCGMKTREFIKRVKQYEDYPA